MQYYYEIEEAWKLFVREGVVKGESLSLSLIKLWQLSKIRGVDYTKSEINLRRTLGFNPKYTFDAEFLSYASENNLSAYIVDKDFYVHDVCGIKPDKISIYESSRLLASELGYLAIHLAAETGDLQKLNYAENYVYAFHSVSSFALPITNNGKYYVYVMRQGYLLEDEDIAKFIKELKLYLDREMNQAEKEKNKQTDYICLIEVDASGEIKSRLTNTDLNSYFKADTNLIKKYRNLNLKKLFLGEKQTLIHREDEDEIFLLSPIKRKNSNEMLCTAEKLETSYRAFYDIENSNYFISYPSMLPREIYKKLNALLTSSYPFIVINANATSQSLILSIISSQTASNNKILFFSDCPDTVFELASADNNIRKIYPHNYSESSYHIIVGSYLDDNKFYKLVAVLNHAFSKKNTAYKLIFYIELGIMDKLRSYLDSIYDIISLHTISFTDDYNKKLVDFYFSPKSDNDKLSKDILSFNENSRDQRVLRQEIVMPINLDDKIYRIKNIEKTAIIEALISSDNNISLASKKLGIARATLYRKMKEYGIK